MQQTLAAVRDLLARLVHDESGSEPIEYALLSAVVTAVCYSHIEGVGRKVTGMWQSLDQALGAVGR